MPRHSAWTTCHASTGHGPRARLDAIGSLTLSAENGAMVPRNLATVLRTAASNTGHPVLVVGEYRLVHALARSEGMCVAVPAALCS